MLHNKIKVSIKKLKSNARIPQYATDGSAGADLCACLESAVRIAPEECAMIPTGVAVAIPSDYVGLIYARSGLACKKGIAPRNKVGVIDSDYRGELIVALYNQSKEEFVVNDGDRIAQLVITPYYQAKFEECDDLSDTTRGSNGFGSTGKTSKK